VKIYLDTDSAQISSGDSQEIKKESLEKLLEEFVAYSWQIAQGMVKL